MSLEELFSSSILSVAVPDTSVEFPLESLVDNWLERLKLDSVQRDQAFFDEQLQSFLTIRIENPTPNEPTDPKHPPEALLSLLAHLQVSLEASYISSIPTPFPDSPRTSRLSVPPRTASLAIGKPGGRLAANHPSIFPPSTPNPTPAAGDHDRKYLNAEGTLLVANIWGQNTEKDSQEAFALLWSEEEQKWVAVYRLGLTVSFLRLNFPNPLLCLTVSATLREKPILTSSSKHPLARFFESIGDQSALAPDSPTSPVGAAEEDSQEDLLDGFEEVNLLEGLFAGMSFVLKIVYPANEVAGPSFSKLPPGDLTFPSTRLGTVSRQKLFALPPVYIMSPATASPSPMTAVRKAHPTLRKSFRKTLKTVSGFRVRMRTVFVPYVLLPETEGLSADLDEKERERERREAGNEERTVVLCVEVENSSDGGAGVGFEVEKVDVSIGGDGAKATLIGWGDEAFSPDAAKGTFPLKISPLAQYNLLYAVTFLRSPEEMDAFSFARTGAGGSSGGDLQRAVAINIFGRPYIGETISEVEDENEASYPTRTFSSRWNCVLDLSAHNNQAVDPFDAGEPGAEYPNVLPEPASPFPVFALRASNSKQQESPLTAKDSARYSIGSGPQSSSTVGGNKRHTLPDSAGTGLVAGRSVKAGAVTPNRASTSFLAPGNNSPLTSSRISTYLPPSTSREYLRSPTTYSAPPPLPPPPPDSPGSQGGQAPFSAAFDPPATPAYPSFPPKSALPPTPMSSGPVASQSQGNVGPSVEIRRELGVGSGVGMPPPTPGPYVSGAFGEQRALAKLRTAGESGESVVVSVGLLPVDDVDRNQLGSGKIYPFDMFTLDVFVFNQSLWPRRFEVTCPGGRRRRRDGGGVYLTGLSSDARKSGYPGVLPLDSRVRIGPLRPSACQSVRMDFLAISPGVHCIEALTLTDVETGFSMNLRSVMDIVVHDPND
ncbi:TRAPP trafficking subunit Trs65-domain-containing protein [Crucibulum laeve]|uniref:TRAPP trafficking subunit Trs65-domain-containing protein n=1 Tax=Crucibulum laeve TaxID=68775 RepID=A0A5C3LGD5_9AGAR|nr:TRAPP trafficking subunit Trs65-domain-containing protein [Crucibulum laeve]